MLENPPMWLNYNNSAKMSGPKFLHSTVTDSLQVIANAWWQLLLLRVAQPVIRFRGQALFHTGPCGLILFSLHNKKLHSKTACCVYLCYLWLIFKLVWWSETLKCDKHAKKNKNQEGGQHFFTPLYICTCVYIFNELYILEHGRIWNHNVVNYYRKLAHLYGLSTSQIQYFKVIILIYCFCR